ncbi:helix-turn-helix domain-containing protein [Mycolicibacterium neoaurum]|uniref:helix-turn-helix domain-containing protein n=1 Tax=Mycolicibacterium neoaurum TaxID=1795 RepID=UPI00248B2B8E|nr:helix-turn-helix domain-containing protein [Mycolicibacterium neoaurum]WBP93194.1 helix-turn-helix domain-containing protein [Mycolicibacterium neoaurum]WBS06839.1 helix-turn-helix domain-containing protein [Mycolicibacterium neoaurum]
MKAENGDRQPRTASLPRPAKQLRPAEIEQILTAWHELHNVAAIARQLGWDYTTIRKYLQAAGIDTAWRTVPNLTTDRIIELHLEGQSTRKIAAAVGCGHNKVWHVIRDYKAAQAAAVESSS